MSGSPPRTPLVNPKQYFDETDDPLAGGLAAFALYLIGTSFLMYTAVRGVVQRIQSPPVGLERHLMNMVFGWILISAVLGCIVLLGIAAILHYGSGHTSMQRGEFHEAVAVAAWGYAPNALSVPFSYLLIRRKLDEFESSITSPEALRAQAEAMQSSGGSLHIVLSLAVIIWSVYILGHGIHSTHNINLQDGLVLASFIGLFAFIGNFI